MRSNINGDWEHGLNIILQGLDNPGWMLDVRVFSGNDSNVSQRKSVRSFAREGDSWIEVFYEDGWLKMRCGVDDLDEAVGIIVKELEKS